MSPAAENPESRFTDVLVSAARLPGVRIHRDAYLRSALARHCSEDQLEKAIAESPAAAGVSLDVLNKIANDAITFETTRVTAISAAAGIPGGFALIGTIPADLAQYFGHILRISQKLGYLYSWPDLFAGDGDEPDDATKNVLILFIGVMFGAQAATQGVTKLSGLVAAQVIHQLPKQALTKGALYPIVKQVAALLGVSMTKQLFAKGISKVVPVVGALASGGVTLATFLPMSKRLKKHLAGLDLADPIRELSA